jgi:hypothetical protein
MELSEIESLRRAAAVHEAGHAIVAWALGLKVRELRIGDAHGGDGRVVGVAVVPDGAADTVPTLSFQISGCPTTPSTSPRCTSVRPSRSTAHARNKRREVGKARPYLDRPAAGVVVEIEQ